MNVFAHLYAMISTAVYTVPVHRVIDGDTFKTDVPLCLVAEYCGNVSVRIRNLDTPELRTKDTCEKESALAAKGALEIIFLNSGMKANVSNIGRDNFGRILADVYVTVRDTRLDVASLMKIHGFEKIQCSKVH